MNKDSIDNIIINLVNNKTIIADNKMFDKLYISKIDADGNEIPYKDIENLFSNFFMVKLKNKIIEYNLTSKQLNENAFKLINNTHNIESVIVNFKNGNSLPFIINSNKNFYSFKQKNDLCIVQSEFDIKYYENLFI